jgi:DNA invertase Pin-like site-specific DNA recombinase
MLWHSKNQQQFGSHRVRESFDHHQNPQLQLDALEEAGATRIFTDLWSERPNLVPTQSRCLPRPSPRSDVLTVWKLDRLGRNTQHVLAVVEDLASRDSEFRSVTEGLHTEGRWARPC